MTPQLTPEMRTALAQSSGQPVIVEDDVSHRRYVLVDAERGREMVEQWIRDQLQIGLDAADRGEVMPFDADDIKRSGRSRRSAGA